MWLTKSSYNKLLVVSSTKHVLSTLPFAWCYLLLPHNKVPQLKKPSRMWTNSSTTYECTPMQKSDIEHPTWSSTYTLMPPTSVPPRHKMVQEITSSLVVFWETQSGYSSMAKSISLAPYSTLLQHWPLRLNLEHSFSMHKKQKLFYTWGTQTPATAYTHTQKTMVRRNGNVVFLVTWWQSLKTIPFLLPTSSREIRWLSIKTSLCPHSSTCLPILCAHA